MRRLGAEWFRPTALGPFQQKEESPMKKALAIVLAVVSLLLVAPLIESGTSSSTQIFQAVGTAEGGGGA